MLTNDIINRYIHMSDKQITECLEKIINLPKYQIKSIPSILSQYCQIQLPPLPPLPQHHQTTSDLYEDKFIPSPDLVAGYQANTTKTACTQPMAQNTQVKELYGDKGVKKNVVRQMRGRPMQERGCVFVQEKEEAILQNLRENRIEGTIPKMEMSLLHNEVSNLERKNIKLQNREDEKKLADWKKIREKIIKTALP